MIKKGCFFAVLMTVFALNAAVCKNCGENVSSNDTFCFSCGGDLSKVTNSSGKSPMITPLKVSLFDQCGIPATEDSIVVGLDVSLCNSKAKSVYGISLGGVDTSIEENMGLIQIGGLGAKSKCLYGIQIGGLISESDEVYGFQVGVIATTAKKRLRGIQIGFFNGAPEDTCGLQIGFFNTIGKNSCLILNMRF